MSVATPLPALGELSLKSFKSFRNSVLPIDPFTLLVGRNGSGKSNALDGLTVLSQLATGLDIREALDGGRDGPDVRGGALGCPPIGESDFTLGCTVRLPSADIWYEVTIGTDPVVQVRAERLWTTRQSGPRRGEIRDLLKTDPFDPRRSDIIARWDNQKRGLNPPVDFRASQLLLTQVAARVPSTSVAGRQVHEYASQVLAALRSVFVLDPVPNEMRQYVRRKDNRLRRNAANLSATVALLLGRPAERQRMLELVSGLSEADVVDLRIAESELDDVMLALVERIQGNTWPVPARQSSDGTLRFLALLAALLEPRSQPDRELSGPDPTGRTTLVVEELENGLHPSQAERIIGLLRTEASTRDVQVLATSHSPALLDALPGELHNSVVVCFRQEGLSQLCRLPRLNTYLDVMTSGTLGDAAVADTLRAQQSPRPDPREALRQLFEPA